MRNFGIAMAACAVLLLAGCGQADNATVDVASVPPAEIWVDGAQHGMSPATLTLPTGDHKIELRRESFETVAKTVSLSSGATASIDETLVANDPSDPASIAALAESMGVSIAPFEAPEVTRGHSKKAVAVILWPKKDVRKEGLTTFAIEATVRP